MSAVATLMPSSADAQIADCVAELLAASFPRLRAVVLTGSVARGESTWIRSGGQCRLIGDAEFLLILPKPSSMPSAAQLGAVKAAIKARLRHERIAATIELSPVGPRYLRRLQPHIFAFELVTNGKVVWGDRQVLDLVPRFTAADIPLEDGFRLLMNRIIELLGRVSEAGRSGEISGAVSYPAVKLWLDMATSFLLFSGEYRPSYRARAQRLSELSGLTLSCPVERERFIAQVAMATRCKISGSTAYPVASTAALFGLIEDAHALWRWELARLTGTTTEAKDDELLRLWIAAQQLAPRLRGWASLVKRCGAGRSMAHLPQWLSQARCGSPRSLVYAAASRLFFALPRLLANPDNSAGAALIPAWRRTLPMSGPGAITGWRSLGKAIAWNYHQFLEFTRA
jgi:hypothetical protein